VAVDDLVIDFGELSVITVLAFDAWLVADTLYPLVIAGYRVATAALFILPTVSKYIRSPSKQTFENGDLLFWRIGV